MRWWLLVVHVWLGNRCAKTLLYWLCYRIVHGLAGPGGVLGLVPAVQLHNVPLAVIYLGTFCLCSTLTMGFVAFGYGACSSRVSNIGEQGRHRREFLIACLSSGLSIVVGVVWLVLLAIGKLEDVFPWYLSTTSVNFDFSNFWKWQPLGLNQYSIK